MKQLTESHVRHDDPEIMSISHIHVLLLPFAIKVMLHWSTCNANLQRRFATHVSRTNWQTCYTFESLSKTCNTLQHCKYREKSFATGRYTKMIFRATSYYCKLALQVDQCNTTFSLIVSLTLPSWSPASWCLSSLMCIYGCVPLFSCLSIIKWLATSTFQSKHSYLCW